MDDRTLPSQGLWHEFNAGVAYLRREGHEPKATLKRADGAICLVLACNCAVASCKLSQLPEMNNIEHFQCMPITFLSFFLQGESGIEFLRSQPQFRELRRLVQQNPQTLPQLLQQIGQDNPDLLQVQCIVILLFNLWFWSLVLFNDEQHTQVLYGS